MRLNLETFSIKSRFALLFLVVSIGFATYAGMSLFIQARLDNAWTHRNQIDTASKGMQVINSALLELSRTTERFVLNKDPEVTSKIKPIMTNIDTISDDVITSLDESRQSVFVKTLGQIYESEKDFTQLIALAEHIGVDEKSGLNGELRSSVHWVENALKDMSTNNTGIPVSDLNALKVEMLMLRRHEKDFMLRGSEKYISRFNNQINSFQNAIASSGINYQSKQKFQTKVTEYQKAFSKWSDGMNAFTSHVDKMRAKEGHLIETMTFLVSYLNNRQALALETFKAEKSAAMIMLAIITALCLGIALLVMIIIAKSITKPISGVALAMTAVSKEQDDVAIPNILSKDELGQLAHAAHAYKNATSQSRALRKREQEMSLSIQQRQKKVEKHISAFRASSKEALNTVLNDLQSLNQTSSRLASLSAQASNSTSIVEKEAQQATSSVQTVASATNEMSNSIDEIDRKTNEAANASRAVLGETDSASNKMVDLRTTASEIGRVVELIKAIAEQTNLLALNATIEAARAGDAGRGFAVVAGEVKVLSEQTARAVDDIQAQIQNISQATSEVDQSVEEIGGLSKRSDGFTSAIASAVSQQTSVTMSIDTEARDALNRVQSMNNDIAELASTTRSTQEVARVTDETSERLKKAAALLQQNIDEFLQDVAA